jgi:aromatic ring-opening dioxygenase catalytic subunit (LigB family)
MYILPLYMHCNCTLPVVRDPKRGYDHGVFIPLKLVFPEADIPVVQLSLKSGLDPTEHINLGMSFLANFLLLY